MTPAKSYVCPGESHPISRSIHLARLAAYYPKCRDCPCRHETGQLPPRDLLQEAQDNNAALRGAPPETPGGSRTPGAVSTLITRHSPLTIPEGLRGRYLNELDRSAARRLSAAFASLLWECLPEEGEVSRPCVVIGYDERPSSPDLVTGAIEALQQMGCSVLEIGPTMPPHFRRLAADLLATGGILVTGAGCDPSWNGLEFLGPAAVPIVRPSRETRNAGEFDLADVERRARQPVSRPTRSAGSFRTVRDWEGYERSVRSLYHALRPLNVVVGTATAVTARFGQRLFASLPCRLTSVELPVRARQVGNADDADVQRLGSAVCEAAGHLGFLIDDDAQRCAVLDERGRLVSGTDVLRLLATSLADESAATDETATRTVSCRGKSPAEVLSVMNERRASVAEDGCGRFWFRDAQQEEGIVCDAFVTLARVLAALSRSDGDCSQRIAGLGTDGR